MIFAVEIITGTPRQYLEKAKLPLVDQSICVYFVKRMKDELAATLKDPSTYNL